MSLSSWIDNLLFASIGGDRLRGEGVDLYDALQESN